MAAIATTIFPSRYVQGAGALGLLADEVARFGSSALAIVDKTMISKVAPAIRANRAAQFVVEPFGGECCDEEIARLVEIVHRRQTPVIVGIGGGKTLDTAKAVAHAIRLPVIVAPTLASSDAPCSALSVIYSAEGALQRYLVLPHNPDCVLVDTKVIVEAPVRFLVSGMGDALSTWFEAEDCMNVSAPNMTGRVGSMTAYSMARLCYVTLTRDGAEAKQDCEHKTVTPAFERVVEANTLLSGLGFESGGLSGAHAIYNGLTRLPGTHGFWHGEMVAFGTLALLMLSGRPPEVVAEVYDFCEAVGLPTCFADIGIADVTDNALLAVAKIACAPENGMANVSDGVTPEDVVAAMKAADAEGRRRKALRRGGSRNEARSHLALVKG